MAKILVESRIVFLNRPVSEIRTYIDILEQYCGDSGVLLESDVLRPDPVLITRDDLLDLVFRIRSYAEPTGGEYAQAFEDGLEMAASMIENLANRVNTSES